ncbi:hypothetical protein [Arthrobacter pascens]|uniref:hypothetical protein n=1 Tax=Arthrobacter pascens TaxID=1677 RepID=UPI00196ABD9C|nr:hypothetical protein [Arthrobacter pascens]MBN3496668.1 hypothetical protein [Arthrobacter pascens]
MDTITALLIVNANAASRASHRKDGVVGSADPSCSPDFTDRRAIHPAIFASIDGSKAVHRTRRGECDVSPPHE